MTREDNSNRELRDDARGFESARQALERASPRIGRSPEASDSRAPKDDEDDDDDSGYDELARPLCKPIIRPRNGIGSGCGGAAAKRRRVALFILLFHIDCCYFFRHSPLKQPSLQSAQAFEEAAGGYAPRITIQPNDLIAIEGESTELNCDAEGEPQPSIEWYHNGQLIKASSQSRTTMGGSIQFLDIRSSTSSAPMSNSSPPPAQASSSSSSSPSQTASDAGIYHCLARNSFGQERSRNASLRVACKYAQTTFASHNRRETSPRLAG